MTLPPVQDKVRELCGDGTTSMKEVVERLTMICEKPINLIEYNESWGSLTAFKAEFEDRINVYFPPQKSQQYKLHCIYHELGHIYLESLQVSLALPDLSGEMLRETADAISITCRSVPNHPVERWVEDFAFEMSKKTRSRTSSGLDPFL
ncbi:hypothetical protein QEH68_22460 (plasmid) [Paenarthrobacter sp. OM7]|uniref:hypothetical protein n=1 Tax=Paenarthrobacter sp. OM7 TaxID=3041264 RepID=UPI0024690FE7|nr:hypothetical protein [Paenarthrobacter sp. OM7]WGM22889.1 hypothetical protein QEH68_22460 [Paenarthrobacter sp. OM7]